MKKIYTLAALLLATTTATFAQRVIDLEVIQVKPTNGTAVVVGTAFDYEVTFKNKGTGTILPADTLLYTFTGTTDVYYRTGVTKNVNDTFQLKTQLTFSAAPNGSYDFCTIAAIVGNNITDPDTTNDFDCSTITISGGTNSVKKITAAIAGNRLESFAVSPNPAVNEVSLNYVANSSTNVSARVLDIRGRTVMTYDFGKGFNGKSFKLDVSALNSGIYFIEMNENGRRSVGKMIKQ